MLRTLDDRKEECKYVEKKYGHKKEFIDLEARNSFQMGKVTASMINMSMDTIIMD